MPSKKSPIKNIFFTKKGGIMLLSLKKMNVKHQLISNYLEAVRTFSHHIILETLCSIKLSNQTISFYHDNPAFYIIIFHDDSIPLHLLTKFLREIHLEFLKSFPEIEMLSKISNLSSFNPFIPKLKKKVKRFSQDISTADSHQDEALKSIPQKNIRKMYYFTIPSLDPTGKIIKTTSDEKNK